MTAGCRSCLSEQSLCQCKPFSLLFEQPVLSSLQVGGEPPSYAHAAAAAHVARGLHGPSSSCAVPAGWKRSLSVDACALGNDTRYINSSRGCPLGPNLTDVEVRSPHQNVPARVQDLHHAQSALLAGTSLPRRTGACTADQCTALGCLADNMLHSAFSSLLLLNGACSADPSISSADPALTSVMTESGTTFTSPAAMSRQQGHALYVSIAE